MSREAANAQLAQLVTEIQAKFEEAKRLARANRLSFQLQLVSEDDSYTYNTNVEVDAYGSVTSWTASSWNDSGCTIDDDWNSSEC